VRRFRAFALAVVVLAFSVRAFGWKWDQAHFYHPDERAIGEAVSRISFSPLQLNPRFFAYGSFPFYVTRATLAVLRPVSGWFGGYDSAVFVGRILGALWGALGVLVLVRLGRRLYGERAGLLAGLLLALSALHLQTSHFATNDIPLTTLVLLSLAFLVKVADTGRLRHYAAAGAVAGLAVATKFSALPILLPLALAVVIRWRAERRFGKPFLGGALAVVCLGVAFAAGEPYALLDFAAFRHDIVEQSHMVRNAGLLPYTNQYIGVPKVAYDLWQLGFWGMGPLLGLAAIVATSAVLARPRRLKAAEVILLAWLVPFFSITASFDVKFPRYLLPVYPLLALFAAARLDGWASRGRAGRVALGAVLAGTAAWALAFLSIYTRPHSTVTASEWVHAHFPDGTRLLSQDWDEGFPFSLPGGRNAERYRIVTFPFYEPDSREKTASLARELAAADYVTLQTKRIYGAVTRAPDKFPDTNRFFRLLFAGDLGYTLAREFASRPRLLGLELPTELADESISVYDHPKVLIFRNARRLPAPELDEKLRTGIPSRLLSRDDLLRAGPQTAGGGPGDAVPAPTAAPAEEPRGTSWGGPALLFAALLWGLGLAGSRLLVRALGPRPGVWALGKVAGVLLFAYLPWLLASLRVVPLSRPLLAVSALLVGSAGLWLGRRGERPGRGEVRATELAFGITFLAFLAARFVCPDVYWGEKPMDFAFLNVLLRSSAVPPPEPWLSGTTLSYTYFGHFVVAALGRLLGTPPGVLFNLGIAGVAALAAAALFAGGSALSRRHAGGIAAVFLTLFSGNLAGLREYALRRTTDFHTFWATSRVVKDTVNEYPLWTFLFADLHAHVVAIVFSAALTATLLLWVTRRDGHAPPPMATAPVLLGLAALLLGAVSVTSGWSTPVGAALVLMLLGVDALSSDERRGAGGFVSDLGARLVVPAAVIFLGAAALYRPFWKHFTPPPRNFGWERGPFAGPYDYLTMFGLFVVLLVPYLLGSLRIGLTRRDGSGGAARNVVTLLVGVGLVLLLVSQRALLHGKLQAAVSVRNFALAVFLVGLPLAVWRRVPAERRLPAALAAFAFAVTGGCEVVYVWDRMNTLFKYYLEAWLLLGVAGSAVLLELLRPGGLARVGRRALVGAALALALLTTGICVLAAPRLGRAGEPGRYTLDGTAYLERHSPVPDKPGAAGQDKAAIDWINRTIRGIPVLVEAWGPSYQEFSRVTMNTGLPIVLGWDYHVTQRGARRDEVETRKADVEAIYRSKAQREVAAILARYHVAYVYVGPLERETYGSACLARFLEWPELLRPVYTNPGVTIFAVPSNLKGGVPATTVEAVAPSGPVPAEAPEVRQDREGRFRQPRGLALDGEGNVYVVDTGNHRIQKLAPDLTPLLSWGHRGKGPGELQEPAGIALGPGGEVLVADTWNGRVQVFDAAGAYRREWGTGTLFSPRGIVVDADGTVFVADTGNHRIVRYDRDGVKELEWGGRGAAPGQLFEPIGLALDPRKGTLVVCDNGNGRLQVFTRDGKLVGGFPVPGWRSAALSEPYVVVSGETFWVTVPAEKEVRHYTADGRLLEAIRGGGREHLFDIPIGLVLPAGAARPTISDAENRLVVLDEAPVPAETAPGAPAPRPKLSGRPTAVPGQSQ